MLLVLLIGSVALQAWAWRSLARRIRHGALTRVQGAARFAGWAFLPVALFVAGFFAMVGLEEWLDVPLIEERGALLFLPVLGTAILGSLGFAVRSAFLGRTGQAAH
jgi:hypothetical protein